MLHFMNLIPKLSLWRWWELPIVGKLNDVYGRRRFLIGRMAWFVVASTIFHFVFDKLSHVCLVSAAWIQMVLGSTDNCSQDRVTNIVEINMRKEVMSETISPHPARALPAEELADIFPRWATARARKIGSVSLTAALAGALYWLLFIHSCGSAGEARAAPTLGRVPRESTRDYVVRFKMAEELPIKASETLPEQDHRVLAQRELKWPFEMVRQHGLPRDFSSNMPP
jgi:hypothetical protein